ALPSAPGTVSASETGITARTIVIGGTFPLTGPAAAYAPIPVGMKAYFSYINARRGPDGKRGIFGRQIVWKYYDDGYNPANTIQLTRRLVEQDKVFATVGQLGTEHNLAVRPYLNQRKVPQVLVSTGASYWGTQYKQYPWTIGWQPDYIAEGRLYGLHIRQNQRGKKIAVLYQNDDYGKDYLYGMRSALGKAYADQYVVAQEGFEVTTPDVRSQMARIRASGAEVFVILATPTFTIQAYAFGRALGFRPDQIYVNSVSATAAFLNVAVARAGADYVNGSLSVTYLKDPSNPAQANDPAIREYRRIMERYAPGANASNQLYLYGFAKAETFVQAMYKAGRNPTRAGLMNALLSFKGERNRFLLNGVVQRTSKKDWFIVSQMKLQRFQNGVWNDVGNLVEGRPR
ncbi:MAG TPA: ABC transporter substrate-binding protein, partial [Dehalococcoidia bacterium]|nr:ABC transporter substrate-binding protein [Dehalococcoidia bacterium]